MTYRTGATSFRELVVWQKAHKLVVKVYRFTENFPRSETYGLTSQIRRSAVSIAANIAEGFKKRGIADKLRYLNIAQGSLEECRYYLILSQDLSYGQTNELEDISEEVSKLLEAYSNGIRRNNS
jgi:four helix bundle protein